MDILGEISDANDVHPNSLEPPHRGRKAGHGSYYPQHKWRARLRQAQSNSITSRSKKKDE
jgi:hypothetical protein